MATVTIKTLKDLVKRSSPHLTDEEIEAAKIIIDSEIVRHYLSEEYVKIKITSYGEVRIVIDVEELV